MPKESKHQNRQPSRIVSRKNGRMRDGYGYCYWCQRSKHGYLQQRIRIHMTSENESLRTVDQNSTEYGNRSPVER